MSVDICHDNHKTETLKVCEINNVPNTLDYSIHKIIEKEEFINYKVDKKCVSTGGGNYLGVLYEIDIKGITKDGEKNLHLFVKNIMPGEDKMKILNVSNLYKTETFVYKELSRIFEELQDEYEVPFEERYKMVKSYDESNKDAIIMENLTKKGFKTYHRMEVVSLEFAELSIKTLAKLHGLSFVLKEKRPVYFERKIRNMKYPFIFGDDWNGFVESLCKISRGNTDDDVKERMEKIYSNIKEKHYKYFNDEATKRCLVHGDYRPNNIMTLFRNGEATEVIPVDYQILSYSCPILDFFYFIYSCTDRDFRKKYLHHLKKLYYQTMTNFLDYFNINISLVFSRSDFEEMYRNHLDFGILFGILFLPFMLASEDDAPDVTSEMADFSLQVDKKYKSRFRDIIEDAIEWGLI